MLIGYYVLSDSYSPLINWLSPYLGGNMTLILGLFFMLLGNPLDYPVLIAAWIVVGVIIGLSARRVLGSIVSSIFVHLACVVILLIGIAGYVLSVFIPGSGFLYGSTTAGIGAFSSLSSIPVPPYGTNILTLLTEPVIYQIYLSALNLLLSGPAFSGSSPSSSLLALFARFAGPLIISAVLLFIINVVTASLVAHYVRKFLSGTESRGRGGNYRPMAQVQLIVVISIAMMLVMWGAIPSIPPVSVSNANQKEMIAHISNSGPRKLENGVLGLLYNLTGTSSNLSNLVPGSRHDISGATGLTPHLASNGYDEGALGLISPDGNMYSFYSFVSNYSFPQNSVPDNGQVSLSILVLVQNLIDLHASGTIFGGSHPSGPFSLTNSSASSFLELLPPELLIIGVIPGSIPPQNVASGQVSYYSKLTGESFTLLASLPNQSLSGISLITSTSTSSLNDVFVYGGNQPARYAAANIASTYLYSLHPDGIIRGFADLLAAHSLFTPTLYGSDSALMVIGYSSHSILPSFWNSTNISALTPFPGGAISFCLGFFYRTEVAFGSGIHMLQLSSLIGNKTISFSPTATSSIIGLFTPRISSAFSLTSISSEYNATIYSTSNPPNGTVSNGSGWVFINETRGSMVNPSSYITFSSPLSPEVTLLTSDAVGQGVITVKAAVKNLGNTTLKDVSVFFPGIEKSSGLALETAGSAFANTSLLQAGQTFHATFNLNVSNPGVYVVPRITYSYYSGGLFFSQQSAVSQVTISKTSLFTQFPVYLAGTGYGLESHFSDRTGYGEILLVTYTLLTLFMGLAVYSEYVSFRNWKRMRKEMQTTGKT